MFGVDKMVSLKMLVLLAGVVGAIAGVLVIVWGIAVLKHLKSINKKMDAVVATNNAAPMQTIPKNQQAAGKTCPYCGATGIASNVAFCATCGNKI